MFKLSVVTFLEVGWFVGLLEKTNIQRTEQRKMCSFLTEIKFTS